MNRVLNMLHANVCKRQGVGNTANRRGRERGREREVGHCFAGFLTKFTNTCVQVREDCQ